MIKFCFKIGITFLLISLSNKASCQLFTSISANSRIMMTCINEGVVTEIDSSLQGIKGSKLDKLKKNSIRFDFYDLKSHNKISSLRLKHHISLLPDTAYLSPEGKCMSIEINKEFLIIDVAKALVIARVPKQQMVNYADFGKGNKVNRSKKIAFANHNNICLIIQNKGMEAYNTLNGKRFMIYRGVPSESTIIQAFFSKNDDYIVLTDSKGYVYLWKCGQPQLLRKFPGSQVRFAGNNSIVIGRSSSDYFNVAVYSLPSLNRNIKYNSTQVLRWISKAKIDTTNHNSNHKITFDGLNLMENSLSPDGKYCISFIIKNHQKKGYVITNNFTAKIQYILLYENFYKAAKQHWVNDSIIFIDINKSEKQLHNVSDGRMVDQFSYNINFSGQEIPIPDWVQANNRIISPDMRYSVLPYSSFMGKGLYARITSVKQEKTKIPDQKFISFTPDSKLLISKDNNNKFFYLETALIAADIDIGSLKPVAFADTIASVSELAIKSDAVPPPDYFYPRVTETRSITELNDSLLLSLKTISQADSQVEIQFHLVDRNGRYYFGAGNEYWKHMWCNLTIVTPDGEVKQINNFDVVEYQDKDSLTNATVLLLDHSGSMGVERSLTLQKGSYHLIKTKNPEDALSVIKFDGRTGLEVDLTKNTEKLTEGFKINGLEDYGGETALLDGIAASVSTLKPAKGFNEKSVILFTDGNENASFSSKRDVILQAIENKVKINTIGFGDYISEDYLRAISSFTEGSYTRLYRTSDLDWIVNDLYKKGHNYYGIRFNLEKDGKYIFMLKLCPPKGTSDTMIVRYNYLQNKLESIRKDENFRFDNCISEGLDSTQTTGIFTYNDLENFDSIKVLSVKPTPRPAPSNDTMLVKEFDSLIMPNIKFVYDRTDIVPGTDKELSNLVRFLKKHPEVEIEIGGYTDERGSCDYNQVLSENRAERVKQLMVKMGISPDRITTVGFGESKPLSEKSNDVSWQVNRRVEFRMIKR